MRTEFNAMMETANDTALGIILPTGVSIWGTLKTLKFEEVGTITTVAGKEHVRKLFNLFKK